MTSSPAGFSFSILGRTLEARGLPADLEQLLRKQWHFPDYDLPFHPHRIVLEWKAAVPTLESGTSHDVLLPDALKLRWFGQPGGCWYGEGESGVSIRFEDQVSRIMVWGASGQRSPGFHAALYVAMCEAVRASGLLPLHASVSARSDTATAFLGPSGTGKTTTLIHAIDVGGIPVAEDLSWLDPDTLRIHGWDRGIRLWPEGQARVADRLPDEWRRDGDGKLILPYDQLGLSVQRTATLTRIVLLHRDPARSSGWASAAPHDAVRALWEATGLPLMPDARARVSRCIAQLLPRVDVRRLWLGSTPVSLESAFGPG